METDLQKRSPDSQLDEEFLQYDRKNIRRTRNIRLVPGKANRSGGKSASGEWCHVVGIFQTLMYQMLDNKSGNRILDVGCGTGILGISAEPFVGNNGKYVGIDVNKTFIDFCKKHYKLDNHRFIHHNVRNCFYAVDQPERREKWPFESDSFDLVTALSVWTHLREEEALFYFKEIERVLKPGKKAIVTFFYLNREYYESLEIRQNEIGRYHMTNQQQWVFEKKAYDSQHWFHLWDIPEKAIAVDKQGMQMLVEHSNLELSNIYNGNWKEIPGIYFQDVLIFQKMGGSPPQRTA